MPETRVTCPVCRIALPPDATSCPDCGQDLSALVHLLHKADILYNRALTEARAGNLPAAIRCLEDALELDGNSTRILVPLGKLYAQSGQLRQAESTWQRVLSISPDQPDAAAGMKWLSQQEEQARAGQARELTAEVEARQKAQQRDRRRTVAQVCAGVVIGAIILFLGQRLFSTQPSLPADQPYVAPTQPVSIVEVAAPTSVPSSTPIPTALPTKAPSPTTAPTAAPLPTATALPTATPAPTATPVPDVRAPVQQALLNNDLLAGIPITVEQQGTTIYLIGRVPSLRIRYLAERTASSVTSVAAVNTQQLELSGVYRVQPGEGLWDIAARVYGSPRYWRTVAKANDLLPPYVIRTGQELILPEP